MQAINLSKTSQKILAIFFAEPEQKFYVNELIRQTGAYPNSIQKALESLEKQKILISSRHGRLKFYRLNNSHDSLSIIEELVNKRNGMKCINKQDHGWVKILNRQTSYSFTTALCVSNMINLKKVYGFSIPDFWHNSITFGVYYRKEHLRLLGQSVSEQIENHPDFARKDVLLCRKSCDRLVEFSKKIPKLDLLNKKTREITRLLSDFYSLYLDVFPFVTTPHGIEGFFEKRIREMVKDEKDLRILLSPASNVDEERESALKIASWVKEEGYNKKYDKLLEKHWEDYCWLPLWSVHAEPLTKGYFDDEVKNLLSKTKNPKEELRRVRQDKIGAERKLSSTLKKIRATRSLSDQVRLLQRYIFLRTYRKNALCQAHYYHLPLIYEVGNRLGLNSEEIKLLSHSEMLQGLRGQINKNKLRGLVEQRNQGWAILMLNGKMRDVIGVEKIIETMERYRIVAPGPQATRIVKGNPACRGKASGRVRIVRKLPELNKVEDGDVLVAKMTTPDYMMAIHKAVAIVTDEGGVTCHAAIVSREFNLPCIVGTRNATQILSDGDVVEVDADNGIVRVVESIDIDSNIKQIYGKTCFRGKVRGRARIVLDANDFPKVKDGDILVASQTTPEYLSSLYKVKGFIVDEDSLTSHAMLYAQALKLPAIMGTQFARSVMEDGEMLELDATNGVVKRLQ